MLCNNIYLRSTAGAVCSLAKHFVHVAVASPGRAQTRQQGRQRNMESLHAPKQKPTETDTASSALD